LAELIPGFLEAFSSSSPGRLFRLFLTKFFPAAFPLQVFLLTKKTLLLFRRQGKLETVSIVTSSLQAF